MGGDGRRQLPSWMMKSAVTEQASISEANGEIKEDGSLETLAKAVKPRKKVQAKKGDTGISSNENKTQLLNECQTRTRKRKSHKFDEVEGERCQEDKPALLKPCKESRKTRLSAKHGGNRVDECDAEKKVDGVVKRKVKVDAPRKKHSRNVRAESGQSEDELTVDDLISIAEEYVEADSKIEFQKSKNLEIESVKKPLPRAGSGIGSEKDLTSYSGTRPVTDQSLSPGSSSTKPSTEGCIINQGTTGDPARDMLELLLGPWLKKSNEVEVKTDGTDPITEKTKLDYGLSKRIENDNDAELAPVVKKKFSLKDNVGKLLD